MFDVTILETNYNYLKNIQLDGYVPSNIKVKVISKDRTKTYYTSYTSTEDFYNSNKVQIESPTAQKYCMVGDFMFIDTITFNNTNVNYEHIVTSINVTSFSPINRNKITYDSNRVQFYESDKNRFVSYVNDSLIDLLNRCVELTDIRLSSYVDACYVNPDYVANEIRIQDSIKNVL